MKIRMEKVSNDIIKRRIPVGKEILSKNRAEAAGFMLQAGGSTVLGFSLDGSSISGCGTMVGLDLDGDATGLSEIIMADQSGAEIPFTYYDAEIVDDIYGCTDMEACNYDMDATMDDGSCDYGTMCEDGSYECDPADCGGGGTWDGDACTMPDHSLHLTSDEIGRAHV